MFRSRKKRKQRRAIESVEVAICLPVLVLTTFATIDICNVIHLKQIANSIAFETVRHSSRKGTTFEESVAVGEAFAAARGIQKVNLTVQAQEKSKYSTRASMPTGAVIRSRVTIPAKNNIPGPYILFKNSLLYSQNVRIVAR